MSGAKYVEKNERRSSTLLQHVSN